MNSIEGKVEESKGMQRIPFLKRVRLSIEYFGTVIEYNRKYDADLPLFRYINRKKAKVHIA